METDSFSVSDIAAADFNMPELCPTGEGKGKYQPVSVAEVGIFKKNKHGIQTVIAGNHFLNDVLPAVKGGNSITPMLGGIRDPA
ncbi:hypothetical protein A2379_02270 [Candidatus Amesbacteria bacterium RIFOXYB1_FULL_47_13]|nr:MAG: hypothetical protein A2379_02270 [Candidatus Amesbacteria bacterium RIFOXYB1_FULL_47_13]